MDEPLDNIDSPLSAATAEAVIERAVQSAAIGMPLAAGLRIAAEEVDSGPLATALQRMAADVERGRSLAQIVDANSARLPTHLAGLVRAAQRTGQLPLVLAEWLESRRVAKQHWQKVITGMTYPLVLLMLSVSVYIVMAAFVVQPIKLIVEEFGIKTSVNTRALFWLSQTGLRVFFVALVVAAVVIAVLRIVAGRAGWSWLITNVPLIGPPWHWTGVIEMLHTLSSLVEHHVPLPEALRLTGDGIRDAHLANVCRRLASAVDQGASLTMSIVQQRSLPTSIVPLVRWGEMQDELPANLRSAADMLAGRLQFRTGLIVQVVPPLIFVMVGVLIISFYGMVGITLGYFIRALT